MKFAARMAPIKPSATLAVTSKAKAMKAAGVDVVSFGAGEPDFPTPEFVVDAMVEAARSGKTTYAPVGGVPALRDAVAAHFTELYGMPFERDHVLVTVGGKHALYNLFQILVDPGDEVIIPAPYWVSYPAQVKLAEGSPVFVDTALEGGGFDILTDRLEAALTDKTVGIVLNSPSNPSGAVYSAESLRAVADMAEARDLWIITDDIYSHLRYGGGEFASVLKERPDLRDRIIVVHGASKTYAMTGWRLGFVGASVEIAKKLATLQGQMTSNATTFSQYGAIAALTSDHAFLKDWLAAYDARRTRIHGLLNAIDGVEAAMPGGAFYIFPNILGLLGKSHEGTVLETDLQFAGALLEHAKVAVVPGGPFGAPGHVRMSYACSMDDIEEGLKRFAAFVATLS